MRRYTLPAIVLHWLIAIAIIGTFTLGLVMTDIQGISMAKIRYTNWHKWAGVTVLGLAALRLLWRLFNHPPQYVDDMPAWQRGAGPVCGNGRGSTAPAARPDAARLAAPSAARPDGCPGGRTIAARPPHDWR